MTYRDIPLTLGVLPDFGMIRQPVYGYGFVTYTIVKGTIQSGGCSFYIKKQTQAKMKIALETELDKVREILWKEAKRVGMDPSLYEAPQMDEYLPLPDWARSVINGH